ncbi:MAG: hypothetical protein RL226_946 [Bacteroidota bacterium]
MSVSEFTESKLNVHWFPGMGADERLFKAITVEGVVNHFHKWKFRPEARSLKDYAELLAHEIEGEHVVYIGSSMGGMMATELMRVKPAMHLILLSAPASPNEFPILLKSLGSLRVGRWMGPSTLFKVNRLANTFMGFKNPEDKQLFYEMLEGYGPEFLHYAVNAILEWKAKHPDFEYTQIIGTEDKLFKMNKMRSAIPVEGSGHFMTWEQPKTLEALIQSEINRIRETLR